MTPDAERYRRRLNRLIEHLRKSGIHDEAVLGAISRVPRHRFVEPALQSRSYADEALPIGLNQTISQPLTVAHQTMLLAPQKGERVLEIGTGSGYQAAVLCEMGSRVFTIERHQALYARSTTLLKELGYRVVSKCGDGTLGWPAYAPFDKILVTAGAEGLPEPLLQQLRLPENNKPGGALVIPVGGDEGQVMHRITRTGEDSYEDEKTHVFRFVPLIGKGRKTSL